MKLSANWNFPETLRAMLTKAPSVLCASSFDDLVDLACGDRDTSMWDVSYPLPDGTTADEVRVVRVKNGICANYTDPYMRRRDPDCMLIGDEEYSDKPRFADRFGHPFADLRRETFAWLENQDLAIFGFEMGQPGLCGDALAVCPANAGFFAFALGLLQGIVAVEGTDRAFNPAMILYVAPPFRHTHFDGKQVVVHNRLPDMYEIFSYNLYPGPSAKKGVYGALIDIGVNEQWVTAHCSAVQVVTPYDNVVTFMHEGASGGGKSEMLQQPHRQPDGRLLLGKNTVTGEKRYIEIQRTCDLHPVCDDMGLCHPAFQKEDGKLRLMDAENAWFIRTNHITEYGTDHDLERLTIAPPRPLLFLNIEAVPGGTALIWDHILDRPGVRCPNPRVVVPKAIVPGSIDDEVAVEIRSFGVRTPPSTSLHPNYGIMGLFHVLPPALAWLWRLVSPRGYSNPSIVDGEGMTSEGVGSYWPFATGRRVDQANLLLRQFQETYRTRYILIPNQHIGAWECGFMPEWIARDYLARRGNARFNEDQLTPSRCPLLGYALQNIRIEGTTILRCFLQTDTQPEMGHKAYDEGARILTSFFHQEIRQYLVPDLDETGKRIIEYCLDGGDARGYERFMDEPDA